MHIQFSYKYFDYFYTNTIIAYEAVSSGIVMFPQEKFQPLQQMVMDEEYPGCAKLLNCTQALDTLHHVADEKGVCVYMCTN